MHYLKIDEILKKFESNLEKGLSESEINKRKEKYGFNEIKTKKQKPFIILFLKQLFELMNYILFIVSLISVIAQEYIESGIILAVILINSFIGAIQEWRANKSVESIKKMTSPHANVFRDGVLKSIKTNDLVIGDVVELKPGDIIGADLRLVDSNYLSINEAMLTGESIPSKKDARIILETKTPLAERKNMAYSGSIVVEGNGKGIVVRTGENTELGKISNLISKNKTPKTPLQKEIESLGKKLIFITLGLIILIFLITVIEKIILDFNALKNAPLKNFSEVILNSIALGVAAIPEGLPAVITIILSLGMRKLSKENAIVKSLPAVEALGAVNLICSDKTGTLTLNKMTLKYLITNDNLDEELTLLNNTKFDLKIQDNLLYTLLCSNAKINKDENTGKIHKIGDATELAYFDYAYDNFDYLLYINEYEIIAKIPFNSKTKKMVTLAKNKKTNKTILIIKGAIDFILEKIKDDKTKNKLKIKNEMMASKSYRTLLTIKKEVSNNFKIEDHKKENDFQFVSLATMYDPPKLSVKETILANENANIKTILITGDNVNTAKSIAKEVGIFKEGDLALNGVDIENLAEKEFLEIIKRTTVFARVSPDQKLRIIKGYQFLSNTVAMIGDGVNDGPALKVSDIGISMGNKGTEVAKDASDLILADDNFETISKAVKQGRNFYENIKKAITFLLTSNLGEIIAILLISIIFASITKDPITPLTTVQILWINLVTDSLMALSLGFDKPRNDLMKEKPRNKNESFLAKKNWKIILLQGFIIGLTTFVGYVLGYYLSGTNEIHLKEQNGQLVAFYTISVVELFHAFTISSGKKSLFKNKMTFFIIGAFLISFSLQLFATFTPKINETIFELPKTINLNTLLVMIFIPLFPLFLFEIIKAFKYLHFKIKNKKL